MRWSARSIQLSPIDVRADASGSILCFETIPYPSNGLDELRNRPNLLTQTAHVRINRSCIYRGLVSPDILQQALARLNASAASRQNQQEIKFGCGERHRLAFNSRFVGRH